MPTQQNYGAPQKSGGFGGMSRSGGKGGFSGQGSYGQGGSTQAFDGGMYGAMNGSNVFGDGYDHRGENTGGGGGFGGIGGVSLGGGGDYGGGYGSGYGGQQGGGQMGEGIPQSGGQPSGPDYGQYGQYPQQDPVSQGPVSQSPFYAFGGTSGQPSGDGRPTMMDWMGRGSLSTYESGGQMQPDGSMTFPGGSPQQGASQGGNDYLGYKVADSQAGTRGTAGTEQITTTMFPQQQNNGLAQGLGQFLGGGNMPFGNNAEAMQYANENGMAPPPSAGPQMPQPQPQRTIPGAMSPFGGSSGGQQGRGMTGADGRQQINPYDRSLIHEALPQQGGGGYPSGNDIGPIDIPTYRPPGSNNPPPGYPGADQPIKGGQGQQPQPWQPYPGSLPTVGSQPQNQGGDKRQQPQSPYPESWGQPQQGTFDPGNVDKDGNTPVGRDMSAVDGNYTYVTPDGRTMTRNGYTGIVTEVGGGQQGPGGPQGKQGDQQGQPWQPYPGSLPTVGSQPQNSGGQQGGPGGDVRMAGELEWVKGQGGGMPGGGFNPQGGPNNGFQAGPPQNQGGGQMGEGIPQSGGGGFWGGRNDPEAGRRVGMSEEQINQTPGEWDQLLTQNQGNQRPWEVPGGNDPFRTPGMFDDYNQRNGISSDPNIPNQPGGGPSLQEQFPGNDAYSRLRRQGKSGTGGPSYPQQGGGGQMGEGIPQNNGLAQGLGQFLGGGNMPFGNNAEAMQYANENGMAPPPSAGPQTSRSGGLASKPIRARGR